MKKILSLIAAAVITTGTVTSCLKDEGNYSYKTDEEVSSIVFDTTGVSNELYAVFGKHYQTGDTISFDMKIKYDYPENLKVCWLCLPLSDYSYRPHEEGNAMVYDDADTVSNSNLLNYVFTQSAGQVRFYCCAEDVETGLKAYFQPMSYVVVESAGVQSGLCLLSEVNGQTDIEFYCSPLQLIYSEEVEQYTGFYSSTHGQYLPGKPKFIAGTHTGKTSRDGYMVCTDQNLYRISSDGLTIMDEWNDMFYNVPEKFNPESFIFTNNADFLINDGQLYTMYVDRANSRKFAEPVSSPDEKAVSVYPYLMPLTKTDWRPAENAINADQVIFDASAQSFLPYYARRSSYANFKATDGEAFADARKVPGNVMKIFTAGDNDTYVITEIDGNLWLYRFTFYNVADDGDFSTEGARSIIDLSGCEHLKDATCFTACTGGPAFYWAYGGTVYSFTPSSGQTGSEIVHQGEAGDIVSCIYAGGNIGGGWPTSNVILNIGYWNESSSTGTLVEYEMDHYTGMPNAMFGPMFGCETNPTITTGWGKIVGMVCLDAE